MPNSGTHRLPRLLGAAVCCTLIGLSVLGCRREEPTLSFVPNLVHSHKYEISQGLPMQQTQQDVIWIVERLFGTASNPMVPAELMEDDAAAASFAPDKLKSGGVLYRQLCANCHGITGDGRGPDGVVLNPYPRDYRKGVFKFKANERNAKPTLADLHASLRNGLGGTAMKPINELAKRDVSDDEVDAIAHYVVYLAMRGETERALVDDAVYELDLEGGDRWFATEEIDADPSLMNDGDLNQESWEIVEEITADILTEWVGAEDTMIQVQRPDTANIPVPETIVELQNALKGKDAGPLKQSIARGREVYLGVNASCSKCHGKEGLGNGQVTDYDDWTRDYTERVKIKPTDHAALQPLYVRGALKPQNILPRNFTEGIYRSGDDVDAMFRKIVQGIAGSPMPASTFVEGKYTEADVWHLINFLRSLAPPIEVEPPREST